ncbi:MAG: phosphodiesterase [Betaproteobacteria bacterium]|nr:phosphodiesterase [Betaproteobacteria bacterium]
MKVVQLSDLHLTRDGDLLYGRSPRARLTQAIDRILADDADASLCLLTGDLADAGSDNAYTDLRAALARLPMPCHLLPGNHDDRAALRRAFPALPDDGNGFVQQALATPAGRFLLLDTLRDGKPWGLLCPARLAWLAAELAAGGDQPLFITMHHPPFAAGLPAMDRFMLRGVDAFWEVIAPHRARIRHLFIGHLHRPIGGSWRGIPFSCVASPNHQVALDTASSGDDVPGCAEPAGYGVILIDGDTIVAHHRPLAGGDTAFLL